MPLPGSHALFANLSRVGARLVSLHLMEVEGTDTRVTFPVVGSGQVDRPRYTPPNGAEAGRVWINGDQYFEGVDLETYASAIGGYQPAEKWLKDRKGRTLSPDDIVHYCRIIAALAETRRRMTETDDTIDTWRLACSLPLWQRVARGDFMKEVELNPLFCFSIHVSCR